MDSKRSWCSDATGTPWTSVAFRDELTGVVVRVVDGHAVRQHGLGATADRVVGDRGRAGDLYLGPPAGGVVRGRQRTGAGPQWRHLRGGGVEAVVVGERDGAAHRVGDLGRAVTGVVDVGGGGAALPCVSSGLSRSTADSGVENGALSRENDAFGGRCSGISVGCLGPTPEGVHLVMSLLEFMQRLAALVPRPQLHLMRFHGVLAPNAKLRPLMLPQEPAEAERSIEPTAAACEVETAPARQDQLVSAAQTGVRHRHEALPQLRRRRAQDHRLHPGAAGDREDPRPPGARSPTAAQGQAREAGHDVAA